MAARAALRPSGKVSDVFESEAERQGAYDLLESSAVCGDRLLEACAGATARRCAAERFVHVPVDGSSLTLTDRRKVKNFGRVGSDAHGARGLKVMTAYAVSPKGVAVGLLDQQWWSRAPRGRQLTKNASRLRNFGRATRDKETQRWLDAITESETRLDATGARGWFQLDREADARPILLKFAETRHFFTIRSRTNRRLAGEKKPTYLRERLAKEPRLCTYTLNVSASHGRKARVARMSVRAARVTLRLHDKWTDRIDTVEVTAVWAREIWTTPRGEKPIDWLLLTNRTVRNRRSAREVIGGYAMRWRIEEFHKTWKTGVCGVENTQLRRKEAVIKWATILATVAARIERLKQLARQTPDASALIELRPVEIRVLVLMKTRQKKRTETVTDTPTIAEATRWIADLGGYTGKSSGGPPGSITIGRGLERVLDGALLLEAIEAKSKKK
jgi:hypothetical protein